MTDDEARMLASRLISEKAMDPSVYEYKLARKLIEVLDRQRWIPVKPNSPNINTRCLAASITGDGYRIDEAYKNYNCAWIRPRDNTVILGVHFWMPLPQPPEQP